MSCERRALALAASVWLLSALPAAAQTGTASPAAVPVEAPDAAARFAEAVKLYKDRKFEQALPLFERLAADTDSPNARLYVGYCLLKLERQVEAYRVFSRLLGTSSAPRADKYDTTREAARAELFALDQRVAKLVVALAESPPGLRVSLDGAALDPAVFGLVYAVEPGAHRIEAVADGRAPLVRSIQVVAGETKTVTLLLPEPEAAPVSAAPAREPVTARDDGATLRMLGFSSLGIGAAGLAVFAVAGISAKSVHDDLEAECGEASCSDSAHQNDASRGKTLQTVANVGLVVGLAGAAGGALLLLVGRTPTDDHATATKSARRSSAARATLSLDRRGGLLSYVGEF
jgi:tetratricopeptide (TPR) repeat protein